MLAAVLLAGCGSSANRSAKHAASRITPQQVETTFSRQGIQLIDTLVYTSNDRPIIRSYDIPGAGTKMNGFVVVYSSAGEAASAEPHARKVYGPQSLVVRANVISQFTPGTSRQARRRITRATAALPRSLA